MSRLTLFRVGFLFLILFFTTTAKAQKEAETFNVDSTLYEYYQRCQECLLEPVVLNMSDTLFRMAGERQDERMQAVAIATQLDYYYFQGTNEDSVIHYTNKVKEFAKATHQPKYYYFAWANRLITYYLKTSRTNIALFPTPASPIKRGLFLFFLNRVSVIKSISFSRPTTKLSDKSFDISFPILYISNFWLLFLSFSFISS